MSTFPLASMSFFDIAGGEIEYSVHEDCLEIRISQAGTHLVLNITDEAVATLTDVLEQTLPTLREHTTRQTEDFPPYGRHKAIIGTPSAPAHDQSAQPIGLHR